MGLQLWVYVPLAVAAVVWNAIARRNSVALSLAAFAAGVLLWTLVEYAMHRFAFHGFAPHWQHHEDPAAPEYIRAPLLLSLPLAVLIWLAAAGATGSWTLGALVDTGVTAGYLAYEAIHLRIHSSRPGGALLRAVRRYHYYHHFADDRVCYGVTSPVWDYVFRTVRQAAGARVPTT